MGEDAMLVQVNVAEGVGRVHLNRPEARNALGLGMFDGLDEALAEIERAGDSVVSVVLSGAGPAFCAGFDLKAVVDEPALMGVYIHRLSAVIRRLRRLDAVVIAAVQGSAVAGGCALLTGCDFVFADVEAKLGYPVHAIGVSPAVTIPTLSQAVGGGRSRALLMSGELLSAGAAQKAGLVSHVVDGDADVRQAAEAFAISMCEKGPVALRATKRWLNELDGSLDDAAFDAVSAGSAVLCEGEEARRMLAAVWASRSKR